MTSLCSEHDGHTPIKSVNHNVVLDANSNAVSDSRKIFTKQPTSQGMKHPSTYETKYNMDHSRRGMCVVLHNVRFLPATGLEVRTGSSKDRIAVRRTFEKLGFEVFVHEDKSSTEIMDIICRVSQMDHSDCDCLAVVILSHGDDGVFYGTDKEVNVDDLVKPFKGKICPSLAGKPKLFFIQACRGSMRDCGVELESNGSDETDGKSELMQRIPNEADILISYSTVAGYSSYREYGSCFIQALCKMLDEYWSEMDLLRILMRVNRRVAYEFEAKAEKTKPEMNGSKQMPCETLTLTKELFFTPKIQN